MKWEIKRTDKVIEGGNMELTLTPYMVEQMRPFFEIEMLQGSQLTLPDGRTRFTFNMDQEKAMKLKQALVKAICADVHSDNAKN